MAAKLVSSMMELLIHSLLVPLNLVVIVQVQLLSRVNLIERNSVAKLAQMLTSLRQFARHRILLRNSNGLGLMYFGWMVDLTMMAAKMMAIVVLYFLTKERMVCYVVNHLALFLDEQGCMEGMGVDESIRDDRKEIAEGNVVAQDFHLLWAVSEMLVAFDLDHLQVLVLYHSVVSSTVVSL